MKKNILIIIFLLLFNIFTFKNIFPCDFNIEFQNNYINEFKLASKKMDKYIFLKYGVNQRNETSYKWRVCHAKYYNCYYKNNLKYFIKYKNKINSYGFLYFGLEYNKIKFIIYSIPWCESGFKNIISKDKGVGIFQVTKKNINKNFLNTDLNIFYGIGIFYQKYNIINKKLKNEKEFIKIFLALKMYNGGEKQILKIINKYPNKQKKILFSGDFIYVHKRTGRFICFERVNTVYPLKIFLTAKFLSENNIY